MYVPTTKRYLSLDDALENHKITLEEIINLVNEDKLHAITVVSNGMQFNVFYEDQIKDYIVLRDTSPEDFYEKRGKLLGITEAGLKYNINPSIISKWHKSGVIALKGEKGRKKLVDEADIAYHTTIYNARNMRSGKRPLPAK